MSLKSSHSLTDQNYANLVAWFHTWANTCPLYNTQWFINSILITFGPKIPVSFHWLYRHRTSWAAEQVTHERWEAEFILSFYFWHRYHIRVTRYNTENVIRVPRYNTENVILRCAVQKSPRILGEIWVFWSNIGDLSILVFLTQQQLLRSLVSLLEP